MFGWQEQEADAAQVAGVRQGCLERASSCAASGGVAVEAEDHRLCEAEQLGHMLCGTRRPQRGHRVGITPLGQRHHVHIAFDDQCVALGAQPLAGFEQAVEFLPFVEDRRFRRIEVLGLADIEHPAAEADDFPAHRADREHDPVAEAVVAFLLLAFVSADDHQAAFAEQRVVVARKHPCQRAPALGCIAHAEAGCDGAGQAALFQIGHCAGTGLERAAVMFAGFGQYFAERGALGLFGVGAGSVFGAVLALWHGQPDLLSQVAHRVHESHAVVFGQESDGVAVNPTAEAVVGLARRADDKAGRLFAVEGAQTLVVDAGLFQFDMAPHDLDDVDTGQQILDKSLRQHPGSLSKREMLAPEMTTARYHPGRQDSAMLPNQVMVRS